MNKRNLFFLSIVALSAMMSVGRTSAAVIEHDGDHVILNIEEMDLKGDESLMDILMTMPDVMTTDGRSLVDGDFSSWTIFIDYLEFGIESEAFLKNTKACSVSSLDIHSHPGVSDGLEATGKGINVVYRKAKEGTSGTVNLEGGSYGNGSSFNTIAYQHGNLNIRGWLVGDLDYSKAYGTGLRTHGSSETAKLHAVWDATPDDNLILSLTQQLTRSRTPDELEKGQTYNMEFAYNHTFCDAISSYFQTGCYYERTHLFGEDDGIGKMVCPYAQVEFTFTLFSESLWLTPGVEGGYAGANGINGPWTDRQRYTDYYLLAEWELGKFRFVAGDRYRRVRYWNINDDFTANRSDHLYNVGAGYTFNEHHDVQASFDHRPFMPDNTSFNLTDEEDEVIGHISSPYVPDCYVTELRYTYQQPRLTLMGLLENTHQQFEREAFAASGNDNNLSLGLSANWKACDWLRLTLGASYNHERFHNTEEEMVLHNNFANLRFVPEVTTGGWRFLATMIYNTRRSSSEDFAYYVRPNFYAALRVSKDITPRWNVYVDAHDLADQRTGNREALLGVTYKW